ncbi:hydrogenase assembly protein HupF [Alphaproteobacteria bacterium]|nr:hydrogenase assembly protein HupF [Alphaproteobacteria bacterium]
MTDSPPAEGSILLSVRVRNGVIEGVDVSNHRPIGLTEQLLVGKEPGEALVRMTRLFSVCRLAQGVAGVTAVEEALGMIADEKHRTARAILASFETVFEHAHRMCLDWPVFLCAPPEIAVLKKIRAALGGMERTLYPEGDWLRPGGGALATNLTPIRDRLGAVRDALQEAALLPSAAARLPEWIKEKGLAGFGRCEPPFLSFSEQDAIAGSLAKDDAASSFSRAPMVRGQAFETGPLARRKDETPIKDAIETFGRGLYARFLAVGLDISRTLDEIESLLAAPGEGTPPQSDGTGEGVGFVDAARGLLAHRVTVEKGRVSSWRTVAPTEWNFHPKGVLALGVWGDRHGQDPGALVRLMAQALDPCVPCRVSVNA